jgi:hypothetical protein
MPSTKMFRDRVVSMEQTFEKGEKYLALLRSLIDEALPGLEFQEYTLDHEHDTFIMIYRTPAGTEQRVRWTRMVLCDAERIPAIVEDTQAPIRGRVVDFLRRRSDRPVIDVTFRHLEEGWVDTPEPRKAKPASPQRPGGLPKAAPGRGPAPARPSPQPGRPGASAAGEKPAPGPGAAPAGRRRRSRRRRGRHRGPGGPPTS